jgi:hypothetical protein
MQMPDADAGCGCRSIWAEKRNLELGQELDQKPYLGFGRGKHGSDVLASVSRKPKPNAPERTKTG